MTFKTCRSVSVALPPGAHRRSRKLSSSIVKVRCLLEILLCPPLLLFPPLIPQWTDWWSKGSSGLAKQLCDAGLFLRQLRMQLRFGELTRRLFGFFIFKFTDSIAECDWVARQQDPWDAVSIRRHWSTPRFATGIKGCDRHPLVALCHSAGYRLWLVCASIANSSHPREVIIIGDVRRRDSTFRSVHSIAMRAKLIGFRFSMEDGMLCR